MKLHLVWVLILISSLLHGCDFSSPMESNATLKEAKHYFEFGVHPDNEPLPPHRFEGRISTFKFSPDMDRFQLEVQDTKTGSVSIVSLFGISPWLTTGGMDKTSQIIESYMGFPVMVVSRTNQDSFQFDKVSIKIEHQNGVLIDLGELLTTVGLFKLSSECKDPHLNNRLLCSNLGSSQRHAKLNHLGMWLTDEDNNRGK